MKVVEKIKTQMCMFSNFFLIVLFMR